ncbi:MAG TPA: thioredoxin family protein [Vicinamibacterales bacterium]|nr:thioredoxin family protein [Vicinamibacterales bacterium]
MALLNAQAEKQVRAAFAELTAPVTLVLFTQGQGGALECEYCSETRELAEELAALSDKITLEVRDFVGDADEVRKYGIDKIPALVVMRGGAEPKDYGIRLYGIPAGYEFATLLEDVRMVSRGEAALRPETLEALGRLTGPVRVQVFVTPTCPYCPRAVLLAHKLAMASDLITGDMVEATEFPHLAQRYHVQGVPRTVINEVIHIEGAVPEQQLIMDLMTTADDATMQSLEAEWAAHDHSHHAHAH